MRGKLAILGSVLLSFLIGGGTMYYLVENNNNDNVVQVSTTKEGTGVIKCSNEITIDETGVSTAIGEIYDATVTIQNYQKGKLNSSGSGFVYKTDNKYGYILTNHHVIEDNDSLVITMSDDTQVEGKVLGSDKYLDLAVVRIDKKYVKQVATIGTSATSNVGDTIITVGSPVGYEYRGTVTRGTLSGKNRMVEVSIVSVNDFIMKVLQIDAAINPGNSGGPLVNIKGEVIGINSLKLVEDEVEGMGFAIPIEVAMEYADELEKGEEIERPFIGISMVNANDSSRLYQSNVFLNDTYESGVVITQVSRNSGAEKAGLKKGDIITALNNKTVSNAAYLKYELYQFKPGDTVEITYIRDGKTQTTKVTLTKLDS